LIMKAIPSSEMSVLTKATRVTSQKTAFFIVTAVKPQILHSINRPGSVTETKYVSCEVRTLFLYPTAVKFSQLNSITRLCSVAEL
jgi:hypothetical protein